MVTFYDSGVSIGMGTLSATGVATLATTVGTGTAHLYTAMYAGDTNYLTSTSTGVSLTPVAVAPTIVLSSSAASALAGLNVVLTARVVGTADAATATPTGMVSFYDTFSGSPVLLGTAALGGAISGSGTATLSSNGLADGTHTIYAVYPGDASYLTVTSAMITVSVADYNVGFSPQSLSLLHGATGSVMVPVTVVGAFQGTVCFCMYASGGDGDDVQLQSGNSERRGADDADDYDDGSW